MVAVLFLSFHIWGVKVLVIGPDIKVAPWDIASALISIALVGYFLKYGFAAHRTVQVGTGLPWMQTP